MSWWTTRYKSRPASNRRSARIAWDELAAQAAKMDPPRAIDVLWYAPEMYAWCARLVGKEDYIEMDVLEVADIRNNPHKYIRRADGSHDINRS